MAATTGRERGKEKPGRIQPLVEGGLLGFEKLKLAERCDLFTKVRAPPQFAHGVLSQESLFQGGSFQQVIGKPAAAKRSSCNAEQFEERAFTEDVQIRSVDMIGMAVFVSRDPSAGPISVYPLDGAIIKSFQAPHT